MIPGKGWDHNVGDLFLHRNNKEKDFFLKIMSGMAETSEKASSGRLNFSLFESGHNGGSIFT